MIKNCETCIHNRGGINCGLKPKYNDYKLEMEQLIEKWGESNGFGFSLDCPSWYEEPNGKQVKCYTNPLPNDDKGRPLKYKPISTSNTNIKPIEIKFDNGSEIKTIPCDDNTRGKRAELPMFYFDYEKCPEDIFESPYIKAKLNDDEYKDSIEILRSLVKSINEANKL